jgi:hypothetical protein
MSVTILRKNNSWYSPYIVPQNSTVIVDIEAEDFVDIYFLKNSTELDAFKRDLRNFPVVQNQRNYYCKINLAKTWNQPPISILGTLYPSMYPTYQPLVGTTWYLIIANKSPDKDIAIFCRVFNSPDAV